VSLRTLLRGTLVVPESKPADDLLDEMRGTRRYFAVVIDEYGGTAGIITLDDLLEALVGALPAEEADELPGTGFVPQFVEEADGSVMMDGLLRLEEWEELTGLSLPEEDHDAVEMTHLGRIPEMGDEVEIAGRTLRVEQLDGMRVALVRMLGAADAAAAVPNAEEESSAA
jgi:putative hemolysin